jgi:ATPase subunit of ABC transporter with duplicated ATPase domains
VATTNKIKLNLDTDQRAGDQVLQVRELSKAFGDKKLWKDIGFFVKRGERIGIIGPNGAGKTTIAGSAARPDESRPWRHQMGRESDDGLLRPEAGSIRPRQHGAGGSRRRSRGGHLKEVRDVLAMMLFPQ